MILIMIIILITLITTIVILIITISRRPMLRRQEACRDAGSWATERVRDLVKRARDLHVCNQFLCCTHQSCGQFCVAFNRLVCSQHVTNVVPCTCYRQQRFVCVASVSAHSSQIVGVFASVSLIANRVCCPGTSRARPAVKQNTRRDLPCVLRFANPCSRRFVTHGRSWVFFSGCGFYPAAAMVNHSCLPTAAVQLEGAANPAPSRAHKKPSPHGAPMQHLAPRRSPYFTQLAGWDPYFAHTGVCASVFVCDVCVLCVCVCCVVCVCCIKR